MQYMAYSSEFFNVIWWFNFAFKCLFNNPKVFSFICKKDIFNWYLSWNIWNRFGNDTSKLYLQQLMSWSIFFFSREMGGNFVCWGNQSLIFSNLTTFLRNQCDKCMFESSLGREVHVSGFPGSYHDYECGI